MEIVKITKRPSFSYKFGGETVTKKSSVSDAAKHKIIWKAHERYIPFKYNVLSNITVAFNYLDKVLSKYDIS